jgi:MFS family permease
VNPPGKTGRSMPEAQSAGLRPAQLAWLAAAVFVVSAGYGALMPLLPGWLKSIMPIASAADLARHVGYLGGVYAAGVLVGAPLWGFVSDRVGRGRILIIGLVGYVASLLALLSPAVAGVSEMYTLRFATGFFVAAVIPVVSALVAGHTREKQRARRFAWLSAVSLLGFLFGPGLGAVADWLARLAGEIAAPNVPSAQAAIVLSALLGAVTMLGLAATLPAAGSPVPASNRMAESTNKDRMTALYGLNAAVMFVLAGFELGILLQGQQHPGVSAQEVSIMFAECSLVMLGVNALLFFTALLEKVPARKLMGAGLILAMLGLAVLTQHRTDAWMYAGISLTAAGTGVVLPVIAYLAAGASPHKLGVAMGGLAAAAGIGQTLGSSVGGWLFGAIEQRSFGWLAAPLMAMLVLLLLRPRWWSAIAEESAATPSLPTLRTPSDALQVAAREPPANT